MSAAGETSLCLRDFPIHLRHDPNRLRTPAHAAERRWTFEMRRARVPAPEFPSAWLALDRATEIQSRRRAPRRFLLPRAVRSRPARRTPGCRLPPWPPPVFQRPWLPEWRCRTLHTATEARKDPTA